MEKILIFFKYWSVVKRAWMKAELNLQLSSTILKTQHSGDGIAFIKTDKEEITFASSEYMTSGRFTDSKERFDRILIHPLVLDYLYSMSKSVEIGELEICS